MMAIVSLRTFGMQTYGSASGSMEPTLPAGRLFAVNKYVYGYSRYSFPFAPRLFEGRILATPAQPGDLVVFRVPGHDDVDYIKRIVGLPGNRVQMRGGRLYLNSTAVERERAADFAEDTGQGFPKRVKRWRETLPNGVSYETLDEQDNSPLDDTVEFTVPADHYFVLGQFGRQPHAVRDRLYPGRKPDRAGRHDLLLGQRGFDPAHRSHRPRAEMTVPAPPASVLHRKPPPHAPFAEHGLDLAGDEEARAVLVVPLTQQLVIVGESMPHIGDEREPGRGLGRARLEAPAVERMVDHRTELVRRNPRRKMP
jgi:signal peptidase I